MESEHYRHLLAMLRTEGVALRAIWLLLDQHSIGDSWTGPVRFQADLARDNVVARIIRAESEMADAEVAVLGLWRDSLTSESFLG